MDSPASQGQRLIWSFWLAAAIVFVGGLLPLFFGGSSSRVAGVVLPFTVGAIGLAACALLHGQGRMPVTIIYFVAGLAIVFGLLSMFSVPLRLAALGSCPIAPAPCTTGLPRALSDGENTGLGSAAAFGIVALLVGFFGLVTLYRQTGAPAFSPPVRKIPPVTPPTPVRETSAAPPEPEPEPEPKAEPEAEPELELPAPEPEPEPEPELELPAPEELPELPAHESNTVST